MEVFIGKCGQCDYVVAAQHLTLLREAGAYHCGVSRKNEQEVHHISEFESVELLQYPYPARESHSHVFMSDSPDPAACVQCGVV